MATKMISLFGSKVGKEELDEIKTSIDNQWLGIGPKCKRFEEEMAKRLKCDDFVMLNSGSNSLLLAVKLLNLPPGSEVIVPSFTWIACGHAVVLNNCKPVFCDVDLRTHNIAPEFVEPHLSDKTAAIMVVHYAGKPVDVNSFKDFGVPIIEDAAHAIDSTINGNYCGTIGDVGIYSFDAVKNLSIGEAGGLVSNNPEYVKKARNLRYCGIGKSGFESSAEKRRWWEYNVIDFFPKIIPDDISASIGLAQLKKLDKHQAYRKKIWETYQSEFKDIGWFNTPVDANENEKHSYFTYCIYLNNDKRDSLAKYLYDNGIYTSLRFHPLHLNRIYNSKVKLPNCEKLNEHALNIPIHPGLTESNIQFIVEKIKKFGKLHC
ncbi:MAG: DegT/DnrJ/EryC1/StrS family aminotransferase [Candidatus Schekmanbacteria bacterium]|nr:MAG: DegT/DnrJ/EryC1/StrS family aminotransferase [Candidatus Schekmanbacteria bacterium]